MSQHGRRWVFNDLRRAAAVCLNLLVMLSPLPSAVDATELSDMQDDLLAIQEGRLARFYRYWLACREDTRLRAHVDIDQLDFPYLPSHVCAMIHAGDHAPTGSLIVGAYDYALPIAI
jgi:hypothetical protein